MKILFLVSSMQGGGAERVAALLANAWAARGHDVTLMPTFSARGECAYPLSEAVQLDFLSDHCEPTAGRLSRLMMLRRFIRSFGPDVIVSFLPHVNVAAILAAMGTRAPVIACERTYPPLLAPPLPRSYRLLRRLTYPFAAALVAQTQGTADWLRRRARRTRIEIIANPVLLPMTDAEPAVAPSSLVDTSKRILLWAGRMDTVKRPELAIDAFASLADQYPDWTLVMLGNGRLRSALQASVSARGLGERIYLPGFAGNLGAWYERADIYIMSSSTEGFPNSLLEAMAHGLASVAFDVPTGPAELSHNGQRLLLLPDNHQTARLSSALRSLMAHADRRKDLSDRAREVTTTYSLDRILAQWAELLSGVTADQVRGDQHSS